MPTFELAQFPQLHGFPMTAILFSYDNIDYGSQPYTAYS